MKTKPKHTTMMGDDDFNPDNLCAGIRNAVILVRKLGFQTTDSGDGSLFESGEIDDACEEPMIAIHSRGASAMVFESNILVKGLRSHGVDLDGINIESTYYPLRNCCLIVLWGQGLLNIKMQEGIRSA